MTEKVKVAFRAPAATADRARAAYTATRSHTRSRSFSDWIADAVLAATEQLERDHHGGQPWPGPPADASTRGRRKGSPPTITGEVVTLGPYLPADLAARAKAAFEWTRDTTGGSYADWLTAAVLAATEQLERDHHDGQPWPTDLAGDLTPGRPLGSRR